MIQNYILQNMTWSFNGTGIQQGVTDTWLADRNVLVWRFFLDPPFCHHARLLSGMRNTIDSFIDRSHAAYTKEMYPNTPHVLFMPHGGELTGNEIPFSKRKHDICFFGSYSKPEASLKQFLEHHGTVRELMESAAVRLYSEPENTFKAIWAEEFGKRGIVLPKGLYRDCIAQMDFVYAYARSQKRHDVIEAILQSGLTLDVFGNGWEDFESDYKSNLCIHGDIGYEEALQEMADSKITLNIMPLYTDGSHERVFNAMGMKSICLTDSSKYLEEAFTDQKHLFYYSMKELDKLPDLIRDILGGRFDIPEILDTAYAAVEKKHLWTERARQIIEYAESVYQPEQKFIDIKNNCDWKMNQFLNFIHAYSEDTILEKMKASCFAMDLANAGYIKSMANSFATYPYWGKFKPGQNEFEMLEQRACLLKNDFDQWIGLYRTLQDHWSREILLHVLLHWETMQAGPLNRCLKDTRYTHYFDKDLIAFRDDEVFVDLGAYKGDTLDDFLKETGGCFQRVYCYECDSQNIVQLEEKARHLADGRIIVRKCAVGAESGAAFAVENENARTGTHLLPGGKGNIKLVCLDDDITEKITFIKSDIEGAELDALSGAENHIRNDHPKLAVSVYHGNRDFLRIAEKIHSIDPSYRYYLRYYGGNLYPNEIVLYAL